MKTSSRVRCAMTTTARIFIERESLFNVSFVEDPVQQLDRLLTGFSQSFGFRCRGVLSLVSLLPAEGYSCRWGSGRVVGDPDRIGIREFCATSESPVIGE